MLDKIKAFWQWFKDHNHAFLFTNEVDDDVKEQLINDLLTELHEYNPSLYFQVGGLPNEDQELIITAEGDFEQFESVERLIAGAPVIENWVFIAFMQPTEGDNTIRYDDVEISRSELWFMPLQSPSDPSSIGIKVCVPGYDDAENRNALDNAVYKMLDTVLGERSFAIDIDYLEIGELPEYPEEYGMIALAELPAYISWKKKKFNK